MCTAILNKSNLLSKDVFENVLDNNPDGLGIGFVEGGKLRTYKDLSNVDRIYSIYKKFRKSNSTPVLIHARIGTQGSKDESNIHPYFVNEDLMMIHNGIIDIDIINHKKSDTWHVARSIQRFYDPSMVMQEGTHEHNIIQSMCGRTNKLVFLDVHNNYHIMNARLGHYDKEGNWYSNHNYLKSNYYDVGGKRYYKGGTKGAAYSYNDYDYGYTSYAKKPKVTAMACPTDRVRTLSELYDDLLSECYYTMYGSPWEEFYDTKYEAFEDMSTYMGVRTITELARSVIELNQYHEQYNDDDDDELESYSLQRKLDDYERALNIAPNPFTK